MPHLNAPAAVDVIPLKDGDEVLFGLESRAIVKVGPRQGHQDRTRASTPDILCPWSAGLAVCVYALALQPGRLKGSLRSCRCHSLSCTRVPHPLPIKSCFRSLSHALWES